MSAAQSAATLGNSNCVTDWEASPGLLLGTEHHVNKLPGFFPDRACIFVFRSADSWPNVRFVARINVSDIEGIFGAGDGIRTHDPNLGKVVLYP
jgi:hypothetical protein